MEIERKFRVIELPQNLEQYKKKEIKQGYLCKGPIVRIRKSNDHYYLTYKNKKGISQEHAIQSQEIEMDLTEESFWHLVEKIDGNIIEKTRYLIPLTEKLTIELDIFDGKLKGLFFAEVEFSSEDEAKEFAKPTWFGEEVSFDKRYRNSYLSQVDSFADLGII
jgi:CYTH domain-containing protein